MVTEFGMSTVLGPVRLAADMQANFLSQQFGLDARVSPETATLVDIETRRILEEAVDEARSILKSHRPALDSLTDLLCEHETVDGAQIDAILGQKEKQEEGKVIPRPAPNGHEPFQVVTRTNTDEQPKGKVEPDSLLSWEDEGGQIATRVNEEDLIKLERVPENVSV
jgi:hypothetical protein